MSPKDLIFNFRERINYIILNQLNSVFVDLVKNAMCFDEGNISWEKPEVKNELGSLPLFIS